MTDLEQRLENFVEWTKLHITGDEKGQAQIFLDRLFQALGHGGCLDTGGAAEFRIRNKSKDKKGTSFADYVWKPYVLIEMKKRGSDLSKHYRQAFGYWVELVPNRPRYVILCNFDELWIYDFEVQIDSPVDCLRVDTLSTHYGGLFFLLPNPKVPIFGNDQEVVTRQAADKLADCFNKLRRRGIDQITAQRFVLQTLVALFSEDIGLLDRYTFIRLLESCHTPEDSYDLLGGLFEAMSAPGRVPGGRFKGVDYFNGGIFRTPIRVELQSDEVELLREAAKFDWSKVRPEIFGALFEHSLGANERHAYGAHFTHPTDIMKIVTPSITVPWTRRIDEAKSQKELHIIHSELQSFRVLDPACGSGNFLYLAYRELKRLEARIYERLDELSKKGRSGQQRLGFVNAGQFYGVDINEFAIEIAKVTMVIGKKLAVDELHVTETVLPLDNLDDNFIAQDALITDQGAQQPWPAADVVIGNPPFLGAKKIEPERGSAYVKRLRSAYPEIPGMADYCVYWFRRAHDHVAPCTKQTPTAGRVGLVGTQNIRSGKSREAGLDYVSRDGTIIEAVDNQPWSGEANVHVSIVNWLRAPDSAVIPKNKRLWTQIASSTPVPSALKSRSGKDVKRYQLALREPSFINSAITDRTDLSAAKQLACNKKPKRTFQGKTPGYDGFVLDASTATNLGGPSSDVIWPYLIGDDILGHFRIRRWIIDFGKMTMTEAAKRKAPFEHCRDYTLPEIVATRDEAIRNDANIASQRADHVDRWWQLWMPRTGLSDWMSYLPRYIACSRVGRRPIFVFVSSEVCPGDSLQTFMFDDDYSFGILQSIYHAEWLRSSSRLKIESDIRYTSGAVFDKFPWPQDPSESAVKLVAQRARELRTVRGKALQGRNDGLRGLYGLLDLPGKNALKDAHEALDQAVWAAYGFAKTKNPMDKIFALNKNVAKRIDDKKPITAPGVPEGLTNTAPLYSSDALAP